MKCVRCGEEFDDYIAVCNADAYGSNICACPHCGKPYHFYRAGVRVEPLDYCPRTMDDWTNPIVNDKDYKPKKKRTRHATIH